jgi:hypothetical protein
MLVFAVVDSTCPTFRRFPSSLFFYIKMAGPKSFGVKSLQMRLLKPLESYPKTDGVASLSLPLSSLLGSPIPGPLGYNHPA